jgi:outer membrane lipase/esterase
MNILTGFSVIRLGAKPIFSMSLAGVAISLLIPLQAGAQGALPIFVENNNGSVQQANVALAVQTICPRMINDVFGDLDGALAAPESDTKDLTLRCNELVQTAVDLNTNTTLTPRGLRISSDELLSSLLQVNGEETAAKGTVATRASNGQVSNIGARLGAVRFAGRTVGGVGVAANTGGEDITPATTLSMSSMLPVRGGGAAADDGLSFGNWGMFVNGSFNTGEKDQTALEAEFDFDAVSVTAGIDYSFERSILGVSVGYDDYQADFGTNASVSGGDVQASGYTGSIFGLTYLNSMYLSGIASFGSMEYDINRNLVYTSNNLDSLCQCPDQSRGLVATPDGDHVVVGIDAGWDIPRGNWSISPHIGVSYRDIGIDGYTESDTSSNGGMQLRFDEQSIESLRTVVGIQFTANNNTDFGTVRPTIRFDWHHEFEDDTRQILAKYGVEDDLAGTGSFVEGFGAGCLSCFSIVTELPEEDFFVAGLGLSIMFRNAFQGFIFYEGLVGYENLTSNAISMGFRGQF